MYTQYAAGAGKTEVTGVTFSDDAANALAGELALLSHPDTETLFFKKLAEKELLSLQYTTEAMYRRSELKTEVVRKISAVDQGPLILCIDTSGSMAGLPERVAKALSLAVLRAMFRTQRAAYIIAFSDRIMTMDIHDPSQALPEVAAFLRNSFHGGTDLRPALNEAMRRLADERYRRADVLIVSDFRVPKILDHHVERIKQMQRELQTGFYSLTVHTKPVADQLNIFDRSWLYDISNPETRGIPIRSLTPL